METYKYWNAADEFIVNCQIPHEFLIDTLKVDVNSLPFSHIGQAIFNYGKHYF